MPKRISTDTVLFAHVHAAILFSRGGITCFDSNFPFNFLGSIKAFSFRFPISDLDVKEPPPPWGPHIVLDIQRDEILGDLQKSNMGIYAINKESGEIGHYDDIGIFIEGVIVLENIGSAARACAMMLGVIYALNLAYPKELRYYYEFIQKVLMQMDGDKLSSRVLGLKSKLSFL